MRAALTASIDAALAAEQYASAHGLSIRIGSEDLRAIALSLFILFREKAFPSASAPRGRLAQAGGFTLDISGRRELDEVFRKKRGGRLAGAYAGAIC